MKGQVSRRLNSSVESKRYLLILLISIGMAAIVFSILIAVLGYNVPKALLTLVTTSFRSFFGFRSTVIEMVPLIFLGYAFSIPSLVQFFNIGGYGQMMFGASVATVFAFLLSSINIPSYFLVPSILIIGTISGGLYGSLAAYLKVKGDIDPIISTIMLNFIALQFLYYITQNPLFADPSAGFPTTKPLPQTALMGSWKGFPYSILIAILSIVIVYILVKKSKLGYEILATGYNLDAARIYRIDFRKVLVWAFFIGGAFAGLAGTLQTININGKLIVGFATTNGAQFGMFGALTALIYGGRNPLGIPIAAFFMSVLLVGANALQRTQGISVDVVFIAQALIVILVVTMREAFGKRR
jgi:ABC-type uncharacterized transport system permease subunit